MRYLKNRAITIVTLFSFVLPATVLAQDYVDCVDPQKVTFTTHVDDIGLLKIGGLARFRISINDSSCKNSTVKRGSLYMTILEGPGLEKQSGQAYNPPEAGNWIKSVELKNGTYKGLAEYRFFAVRQGTIGAGRYEYIIITKQFTFKITNGVDPDPGTPGTDPVTPTPTPRPVDRSAPTLNITGLPTTSAEKNNLKGSFRVSITANDDIRVKSITISGFGQTFIKQTNLQSPQYNNSFTIDTTKYPDGVHSFSVTALDTANKVATFNDVFTVRNGSTNNPPVVTPSPSIPTPPTTPPSNGDDKTFADLMALLVQLLSNLMQVLSNLNLNNARTLDTFDASEMFVELIKTNKKELKRVKQTRKIPKLAKRFSNAYSKAQKAKRAKKKDKLVKKSDRILSRILKNLQ